MKGFYLYTRAKEYFFISDRTRKSRKLAELVCGRIAPPGYTVTERDVNTVLASLRPATCKVKDLANGRWCFINGNQFMVSSNNIVIVPINARETGKEVK